MVFCQSIDVAGRTTFWDLSAQNIALGTFNDDVNCDIALLFCE